MTRKHLPGCLRLIDIGAHNGELFESLGSHLIEGFGIEPLLTSPIQRKNYTVLPGLFPDVMPSTNKWDAITMLAVLEHIPTCAQPRLAEACWNLLRPEGRIVITVPSPLVDHVLSLLSFFRLIDGMSLEEHFGFQPSDTTDIFAPPRFILQHHQRFQLGMNHLFVLTKPK